MRWALTVGLLLTGCGSSLADRAQALATHQLKCAPPVLRVRPVGTLRVRPRAPLEIALYEAQGCELDQLYFCARSASGPMCAEDPAKLSWIGAGPGVARAQHLLRTASRARCPASELRVVQESESLYRFEACDGDWLYHCRATGCDKL